MGWFPDILGTLATMFRVGHATLDASSLTANRTLTVPDASGLIALTTGNASLAATEGTVQKLTVSNTATADCPVFGNLGSQLFAGRGNAERCAILNSSDSTMIGVLVESSFTGNASSSAVVSGINAFANTRSSATGNMTATGAGGGLRNRYLAAHYGSGTVSKASSISAAIQNQTTGTITDSSSFQAENVVVQAGASVNTYSGLWVLGGSVTGTLNTRYGVRVDSLIGGTTRYGIYVQADQCYFGGALKLPGLPTYADQAAAAAGGLVAGDVFKTVEGGVMIKT